MDKIQAITRSLRCFVFGLLGLIPLLGIGFSCLALMHFRDVIVRRGKEWNPARRYLLWGFGLGGMGLLVSLLVFGVFLLVLFKAATSG